jgi:phage anti-repressor protein/5-methylcytosine-specific restriction endonuclease McrA
VEETRFLALQTVIPCDFTRATGGMRFPVRGRDIQMFVGSTKNYSSWVKDQIERAGLLETQDFILLTEKGKQKEARGGHNRSEYYYTIDAAKKICMIASTPKGNEVREYFLECERRAGLGGALDEYDVLHQLVDKARTTDRKMAVLSKNVAGLTDRVTVLEVARVEDVQSYTFAITTIRHDVETERTERLRSEQREARRRRNQHLYYKQVRFPNHVTAAFQSLWPGQDCMMPGCTETNIIRHKCFQWDHVHPSAKGGPNTIENIGLICQWCNGKKRDRLIPDYRPIALVRALQAQAEAWAAEDAAKAAAAQQAQLSFLDSCLE